MREVVSVQIGGYANYVGAHFWNLQDESLARHPDAGGLVELSSDVLFRRAARPNATLPYAPRLQIIDMSGSFGALAPETGLVRPREAGQAPARAADTTPDSVAWDGQLERYEKALVPLNRYQLALEQEDAGAEGVQGEETGSVSVDVEDFGLETNVKYWSDYTKVRFHSRSCYALPGLHYGVHPFSLFDEGTAVASERCLEDVYEGLRFFVEECEHLGGLAITCDVFGGFSGFCQRYIAFLREEFGASLPMMVFGAGSEPAQSGPDPPAAQAAYARSALNESLLAVSLSEMDVQYIPLRARATQSLPYVHPDLASDFETSAVLGASLDCVLAPTRHLGMQSTMGTLLNVLRPTPATFFSGVALAMPIFKPVAYQRSALLEVPGMARLSLPLSNERFALSALNPPRGLLSEVAVGRGVAGDFPAMHRIKARLPIPIPFPRFFDRRVSMTGELVAPSSNYDLSLDKERTEVGELDCLCSTYTSAEEGSAGLLVYANALQKAATRAPQSNTESAIFSDSAEHMLSLSSDYTDLQS